MGDYVYLSDAWNYFNSLGGGLVCVYDGEKFQVLEGSEINLAKPAYNERFNMQRDELLKKGAIAQEGERYILKVTLEFNSPSSAANFVIGGSNNGWTEWKDASGKTLDEVYRKN